MGKPAKKLCLEQCVLFFHKNAPLIFWWDMAPHSSILMKSLAETFQFKRNVRIKFQRRLATVVTLYTAEPVFTRLERKECGNVDRRCGKHHSNTRCMSYAGLKLTILKKEGRNLAVFQHIGVEISRNCLNRKLCPFCIYYYNTS